ncbi:MFS transporter [Lactonifactor longoviformis]|uniref:Major Facilitator Superfamily protein n=2 Tax=Lactonifactor TaxID=420345 RepID=A0A1M4SW48_9CLOT|nr:MFS transporter [Lactonifactor longoviformis]POP32543.1 MFS transporter [Lactonifactor longoviformis]SHE36406.1 Major Facilitator Superfamily protein [Lactonifactor longoviformis DSM 17459]
MGKEAIKKTNLSRNTMAVFSLVGGALVLICTGGGIYGASVMTVAPAAERFGVTTAVTGMYNTAWLVGLILSAFLGGKIIAKINTNGSAILGGVLGFLGLLLMGFAPALPIYFFGAFLTGWPICLTGPALLQTTISKWYYKGRATMIGVVGMTEAIGTTIVANVTAKLLDNAGTGYTTALIFAACFVLVGNLLAGLIFFRGVPEDYGYVPVGAENMRSESGALDVPGLTKKEAYSKSYFWMFLIGMSILNMGYGLVQPQLSAYSQFLGYSAAQAAILVSVWSWGKSLIKIVYGFLGDKFGLRVGICGIAIIPIITGILYIFNTGFPVLILCAAGMGIIGGLTGAGTLGISRMVGSKELTKMALLPHGFNGIGNFFTGFIFRAMFTGTMGGYQRAYTLSVVVLVVYFVLMYISLNKKNMFESEGTL